MRDEILLEPGKRDKSKSRRLPTRAPKVHVEKKNVMKAAAIDRFGPPSVLTIHDLPIPEPGPNEVLIALSASGVGIWDADIRKGWWPEGKPKFPLVLGTDGAGVIAKRGARVRRFSEGDRVWAYEFINSKGGFYAEFVAVNSEHVGVVPKRFNLLQAGAVTVTGLTALQGIDVHLRVKAADTVLVLGASGAVGSLAVQFAKRHGARVIGTGRGKKASEFVRKLGVDKVIDPTSKEAVKQLCEFAPNGIDAALVTAGGEAVVRALSAIRKGGRVAYPHGVMPEPTAPDGVKIDGYDGEFGRDLFDSLNALIESGPFDVHVDKTYRLEEAAEAHQALNEHHLGKLALRIE